MKGSYNFFLAFLLALLAGCTKPEVPGTGDAPSAEPLCTYLPDGKKFVFEY